MSVQYLDRRMLSFEEYIRQQGRSGLRDEDGTPRYAHPVDEWILRTLNSMAIKSILDKAIDTLISDYFGQYLATSISIDERSFPDIFSILSHCAQTLGIPIPHAVTSSSPFLFNAFTAGTDEYSFISITAGLCEYYTPAEAAFVIGHECGHIAAKHMVYHTLVWVMTDAATRYLGYLGYLIRMTAAVPLLAWSRRSEITADRAGLLCCGDIAVAERALLRLVAGHADVDRVDIDDYLRRSRETEDYHGVSRWQQLLTTHPLIPKRIQAMRLFARSELYFELTGKPAPPGVRLLDRGELDRQVNEFVKP